VTKKGNTAKVITKAANLPKTSLMCSHCGINFCIECFTVCQDLQAEHMNMRVN
jgi:hypothetical protein